MSARRIFERVEAQSGGPEHDREDSAVVYRWVECEDRGACGVHRGVVGLEGVTSDRRSCTTGV